MPSSNPSRSLCIWHECAGCVSPLRTGDPLAARQWLAGRRSDGAGLQALRADASCVDEGEDLSRLDDHALLDLLAAQISAGVMRVCGQRSETTLYRLVLTQAAAPPPAPAPSPAPTPARGSAAPPPLAAVDSTFPASLDVAAMVATLRQAAQEGVPFCEECAKADAEAVA